MHVFFVCRFLDKCLILLTLKLYVYLHTNIDNLYFCITMSTEYTPIRVYQNTSKKLDRLKTKLSFSSKIELVDEMVNFFLDEGINPKNRLDAYKHIQEVKKVVTNRLNTAIGFIQENETRYLAPMMKLLKDVLVERSVSDSLEEKSGAPKPEVFPERSLKIVEAEAEAPERFPAVQEEQTPNQEADLLYKARFQALKKEFDDLVSLVVMREVKGERNQKFPVINILVQEWHRTVERINNI